MRNPLPKGLDVGSDRWDDRGGHTFKTKNRPSHQEFVSSKQFL